MESVYELFVKAWEAYKAVPKEFMARAYDEETQTITFSCPSCGMVFAQTSGSFPFFRFNEPIFCCGKLLI